MKNKTVLIIGGTGSGPLHFHHHPPCAFQVITIKYRHKSYQHVDVSGGPLEAPMKAEMPVLCGESTN